MLSYKPQYSSLGVRYTGPMLLGFLLVRNVFAKMEKSKNGRGLLGPFSSSDVKLPSLLWSRSNLGLS